MPEMLKEAPMKSESQRRWMWATHPAMAKRWEEHTPKGKKLPEHVKKAYPFWIDIKLANLGVANVGPASNALAGFGQAMLGSAPAAIPKQTNFVPQPSPSVPPILGGPTAGPGTPVSGGAMPKAPSLDTMRSIGRTSTPTSTSNSTSSPAATKVADFGSVLKPIMNAAQKTMPAVAKAAPKVESTVARSAFPKVTPQGSMSSGPSVTYPTPKAYSTPAAPPPVAKLAPPGSVTGQPPTAQVISKPPTPAVTPPPPPSGGTPPAVTTPPSTGGGAPGVASPRPGAFSVVKDFMTAPLTGGPEAAPAASMLGRVGQSVNKNVVRPLARIATPHSTASELGYAVEKGMGRELVNMPRLPLMPFGGNNTGLKPSEQWRLWAHQNFGQSPTMGGLASAGAQIVSAPGRLAGDALFRRGLSGKGLTLPSMALGAAGAGYAATADLLNQDPNRAGKLDAANIGMSAIGLKPVSTAMRQYGLGNYLPFQVGDNPSINRITGQPNNNQAAPGYGGFAEPLDVGTKVLGNFGQNPVGWGKAMGKTLVNAPVVAANSAVDTARKITGGEPNAIPGTGTAHNPPFKVPFSAQEIVNDARGVSNNPATPQQMSATPPVSGGNGQPKPADQGLGAPLGGAVGAAIGASDNIEAARQQMAGLDQQIATATQAGDHATVAKLNAQKQNMQQGMMAHGTEIAQKAQADPNLQMQGVQNLQKELPEGTPPSFISGLWKIMQSNPWASGLMIAGLGLGALSMMGAFGGNNGIAAIAGLASTMVGAGMMPKELWTQISAKLFGGPQVAQVGANTVANGAAGAANSGAPRPGVANPKLAPGQNNPAATNDPNNVVPPATAENPFPLSPIERQQIMGAPALQRFFPGGNFSQDAVESFVMSGAAGVPQVPGVVASLPPRIRAELKAKLQGSFWARRSQVGQALIAQL